MRKDGVVSMGEETTGLAAVIQQAKENKRNGRFNSLVGSILHLWFYQYIENFHCKPDSLEDMVRGIKYLVYSRKDV